MKECELLKAHKLVCFCVSRLNNSHFPNILMQFAQIGSYAHCSDFSQEVTHKLVFDMKGWFFTQLDTQLYYSSCFLSFEKIIWQTEQIYQFYLDSCSNFGLLSVWVVIQSCAITKSKRFLYIFWICIIDMCPVLDGTLFALITTLGNAISPAWGSFKVMINQSSLVSKYLWTGRKVYHWYFSVIRWSWHSSFFQVEMAFYSGSKTKCNTNGVNELKEFAILQLMEWTTYSTLIRPFNSLNSQRMHSTWYNLHFLIHIVEPTSAMLQYFLRWASYYNCWFGHAHKDLWPQIVTRSAHEPFTFEISF